ncbi:putative retroelement pol polyprotein [Trifolium medium]|uniref:Putative retroelement pol polyprotein n=1 Tax=Trifolium medium TaxID=97028 RepID=A0A392M4C4_9FABA|nr:putative retroelement pol polyprotein [Trifolium medium]
MEQPEGLVEDKSKVRLLKKSLYGSKQTPRQMRDKKIIIYLLQYVDVILMASSSKEEINMPKKNLNGELEMKNLGVAKRILGMDIMRNRDKGKLSVERLINNLLLPCLLLKQKYIALVEEVKEAIWLTGMIGELGITQ